mgnify:CR=1 FL=1
MNYLPFVGFGFYGAVNDTQRANYFASWGLLGDAPEPTTISKTWFQKFRIGR